MRQRGLMRGALVGLTVVVSCVLCGCSASSEAPTPQAPSSAAAPAPPPPATTPVPPPTPGSTASSVPSHKLVKRAPVPLGSSGEAADGVRASLEVKAVQAKAQGPGEVSGPAVKVTVTVDNTTSDAVGLQDASVNVTGSDDTPGEIMSGPPAAPLPTSAPAKTKVTGVYIFTLAREQRNPLTVEVSVSPSVPVAVFRGAGPR